MWLLRRVGVIVFAVVVAYGCGGSRAPVAFFNNPLPLLTWLGEFTRASGTVYPQLPDDGRFGSISGLAPDPATQAMDRGDRRSRAVAPGVGERHLRAEGTRCCAGPDAGPARRAGRCQRVATRSRSRGDRRAAERHVRRWAKKGTSADGDGVATGACCRSRATGVVTNVIEFPKEFQITGDGKTGLRDNQGFEGTGDHAAWPADRGTRAAAVPGRQRDVRSRRARPADRVRAVRDRRSARPPVALHDFADAARRELRRDVQRRRERPGRAARAERDDADLDGARVPDRRRTSSSPPTRCSCFRWSSSTATRASGCCSNFDSLAPRLSSALSRLENFEAMAFGPIVNGMPTLLIASDDNFRKTQKTSFLLFRDEVARQVNGRSGRQVTAMNL